MMPWTRLHALRGYRDLFVELVEQEVQATINLTPILLDQLLAYAVGESDDHLELSRIPASELDESSAETIRSTFVSGNAAMIDAHPDYAALARRAASGPLSRSDLRDLQVWSTLAWFGHTARRDHPVIVELQQKGAGYSESDKAVVISVQQQILEEIPDRLRQLGSSAVGLSTSPYFHPILPLLFDTTHARRCLYDLPQRIPRLRSPEDALRQLCLARDRVEELTGRRPQGLWPSEGAVSPEVAELMVEAGFSWFASDDGVLERSRYHRERSGDGPWQIRPGLVAFFRDHGLSDRLGFTYAQMRAGEAVDDLFESISSRDADVVIALDGENPWEAFADAGGAFRQRLHRRLRTGKVQAVRLDDLAAEAPVGHVKHLHTGSWIGADFSIWFGHEDDRAAWALLEEVHAAAHAAPEPARARALPHLLAAEGSDWTWWYGEDFSTPFADQFDRAFRSHVRAAWRALGAPVPPQVEIPIGGQGPELQPPRALIDPRGSDGWLAWAGAGRATWRRGGSMARSRGHGEIRSLRYGWSCHPHALWIRVDTGRRHGDSWRVEVAGRCVDLPPDQLEAGVEGLRASRTRRALVVRVDARSLPERIPVQLHATASDHSRVSYPPEGPLHLPRVELPARTWWAL